MRNLIKLSSQTENYVKILGNKTHQKIDSYQKDVMNLRTIIFSQLACKLFLLKKKLPLKVVFKGVLQLNITTVITHLKTMEG